MKFALTALLGLASLALAEDVVCPTATRTIQNRGCGNECPFTDCTFHTTIQNPCGCPATLPTATLIAPCQAPCPYQGCDIEFRTSSLACPTTTPKTTTRRPTTTTTTPKSTPTGVITSVVTLPHDQPQPQRCHRRCPAPGSRARRRPPGASRSAAPCRRARSTASWWCPAAASPRRCCT
ncbi:hypothetical protein B0I37DRAFT_52567 [Chaetomium sp. MPI-CAGE-AT-0009]|nr:hypothetical protein B0I37DRAFT_52567 [Chaetomium sp. MPI-CAGE-AT-0009]